MDEEQKKKKKLEEINLGKKNNREKTLEKGSYGSKSKDVVSINEMGLGLKGMKMNVKKKR